MRTFLLLSFSAFFGLASLAGCANEPPGPLIGTWKDVSSAQMDSSGMSMTYTFSPDGMLDITWQRPLVGDTVLTADYEVQWDSVLTLSDARGSEQFIAHVIGDTLRLRSGEGIVQHYTRQPE